MDWVVGIATVVLALLTAWYATLTKSLAEHAADSVEAARRSAAAAEQALLAQAMPVVVARSGGGSMKAYKITLQNLSGSSAIDVRASLTDLDDGEVVASVSKAFLEPGEAWTSSVGEDRSPAVQALLSRYSRHQFDAICSNAYGQRFRTRREAGRTDGEVWSITTTYVADDSAPDGWRQPT